VRYNLAYAYMFAGNYAQAAELFVSIVDQTNSAPDTSYWLGRCYYHLGDIENAEKYLRLHVKNNPQRADSIGTLAMLNMDMENLDQARILAEKALTLNDNCLEAMVTLGNVYLNDQDDDNADAFFSKATAKHPTSGRAWAGLGFTDMLRTNLPKAISDLKKAVQYMPGHIGTWHALAWAQISSNDLEGAKRSFESAMEIDRSFGETHGGLAVIDILQKNFESARERIKRATKLDRGSFSAAFAQSLLLQESDPEKAQQIIKNILAHPIAEGKTLQDTLTKALRKQANTPSSQKHH
jgi:tetratricopeptide (TPR) repeat protein